MALQLPRPYHLNVNCSDLERSLSFYVDLLGFRPLARTTPAAPQPGDAFGLESVQWDAWILQGDAGMAGVVLDLLEWTVPRPTGRPATLTEEGFAVIGIAQPDLDGTVSRLRAAGHEPTGTAPAGEGIPAVAMVRDPDGTLVELVGTGETRLTHVVVNCPDLDMAMAWYAEVLGLTGEVRELPPAAGALHGAEVRARSCYLAVPGAPFRIVLREWRLPAPVPRAPRAANELGIFRHALFSEDIHGDHAALTEAGVACLAPPAALDMGPGLPADLLALFFHDPAGACLELIQPPG
jgi:catechol 2,3-dioxygenase-like lactoylglutathione lyase family enzyme